MAEDQNSREWLLSRDFMEYRHAEILACAAFFKNILLTKRDPEYFQGVQDAIRAVIKVPLDMARTDEEWNKAKMLTALAFDEIEASVLRRAVMGDE